MSDEISLKTLLERGGAEELKAIFTDAMSNAMTTVLAKRDAAENEAAAARQAELDKQAEHDEMMRQHNAAIGKKDEESESRQAYKTSLDDNTDLLNALSSSFGILAGHLSSLERSLTSYNEYLRANASQPSSSNNATYQASSISPQSNSMSSGMMHAAGDNLGFSRTSDMPPTTQSSGSLTSSTARASGVVSSSSVGMSRPSSQEGEATVNSSSVIVTQPRQPNKPTKVLGGDTYSFAEKVSGKTPALNANVEQMQKQVGSSGAVKGGGKAAALMAALQQIKAMRDQRKASSDQKNAGKMPKDQTPKVETADKADNAQDEIENEAFRDNVQKPTYAALQKTVDNDTIRVKVVNSEEIGSSSGGFLGSLLSGILGGLFGGVLGTIVGGLGGLVSGLAENIKGMWGEIGSAFKSVGNGIKSGLGRAWEGLKAGASWIKDGAKSIWTSVKNSKLGQSFSKVVKGIEDFGGKLAKAGSWISEKLSSLGKSIKSGLSKAWNGIKGLGSKVKSGLSSAWNGVKSGFSKLGSKLKGLGGKAGTFFSNFGKSFKAGASKAFSAVKGAVKKIPQVQAIANYAGTVKNAYDVYKNGGNMTDMMTTIGGGTIDALLNVTMISNAMGAVGAIADGKSLKEIGKAALDPTQGGKKVSYGMGAMANIQNAVGNETELTKRLARASNYDMDLKDAGIVALNGNIAGFSSSAYGVAPDKKAAAGSLQNNAAPNASTGAQAATADTAVTNENDVTKAVIAGVTNGVKEAMTSPEVEAMQREASKAAGEAVNKTLMGN